MSVFSFVLAFDRSYFSPVASKLWSAVANVWCRTVFVPTYRR